MINEKTDATSVSTDDVFALFLALAPASPWTARLADIQRRFNLLADGATEVVEVKGWRQLADLSEEADAKFREALDGLRRKDGT